MESKFTGTIRKFRYGDRRDIRRICCETALMGQASSIFFEDDEIFADALTLYFTDYEPESSFVAEAKGNVVGYLVGSKSIKTMEKIFLRRIFSPLLSKSLLRGTLIKKKNISLFLGVLRSIIKREFRMPEFSKEYPATLHINIDKDYRGRGFGSRLIADYLTYLQREGAIGVHFATISRKASIFFAKEGFNLLYEGKRSYFKHVLREDVLIHIYGKKLNNV
ncbi:MAG: GNAT family N-acetyltransferase [Candidatus Omnitrophica bacterium]|nr:GNAT family N-acetyltransferase [Candidatus Omnitrophota bacterium]